jgi:hypothetical protein
LVGCAAPSRETRATAPESRAYALSGAEIDGDRSVRFGGATGSLEPAHPSVRSVFAKIADERIERADHVANEAVAGASPAARDRVMWLWALYLEQRRMVMARRQALFAVPDVSWTIARDDLESYLNGLEIRAASIDR